MVDLGLGQGEIYFGHPCSVEGPLGEIFETHLA